MKRAYSVALVALALLAALATGCSMPDYQLDFNNVYVAGVGGANGNYVTVQYTLMNRGTKDIKNAKVEITVAPHSDSTSTSAWTTGVDISSGSSFIGTISLSLANGPYLLSDIDAYVTQASWDADGSNSIF